MSKVSLHLKTNSALDFHFGTTHDQSQAVSPLHLEPVALFLTAGGRFVIPTSEDLVEDLANLVSHCSPSLCLKKD